MAGREQPGVLEAQRKQAAYGILSAFFDSKRRYQRDQGKLQLAQMRIFLPDDKLVRIVDKGTAQYVTLAKTLEAQEYDIVVDEAPAGPNQKAKVMATLGPLLPEMFQSGIIGPEQIADMLQYMDLPAAVALELGNSIRQRSQGQQQAGQQQQQVEQQGQLLGFKADLANKNADTQAKLAKAEKDRAAAQNEGGRLKVEAFRAATEAGNALSTSKLGHAKAKSDAQAAANSPPPTNWPRSRPPPRDRAETPEPSPISPNTR
jgi:hypothetical protein